MLRKTLGLFLLIIVTTAALPQEAEAQRRSVRRGPVRRSVVYVARPYYPVYYSPFYGGWYGGWYGAGWYNRHGWYPSGFYGQYYPPYRYRYADTGAARIDVKPREAEVFVDGYYVGTVDNFDGVLQRLHLPYGEHEIEVYLPGHRTLREKVLFRPGATVKITGALEPLPAGEPEEPRPAPAAGAPGPERSGTYGRDPRSYPPPAPPRERAGDPRGDTQVAESFGAVAIRVQPGDAEVLIDGDRWEVPSSGERLVVQLSDGEHRIEIRRQGYRDFSTTVRVRRGETSPLNVSLARE